MVHFFNRTSLLTTIDASNFTSRNQKTAEFVLITLTANPDILSFRTVSALSREDTFGPMHLTAKAT